MRETLNAVRISGFGAAFRFAMRQRLGLGAHVATYRVVAEELLTPNRRAKPRFRTRLRAGKLLDDQLRFIADCLIHDRASQGIRICLASAVALPGTLWFYDEESARLHRAHVRWRRRQDAGLFLPTNAPTRILTDAERAALAGRYYAMRKQR